MPQYVLDRVMNKRGRLHVFDALQPERTALVIIDMQNAFVKGKVKAETALAIMPKINQLAAKVRELGGRVAWVQLKAGETDGSSVAKLYHKYFFSPEGAKGTAAASHRGTGDTSFARNWMSGMGTSARGKPATALSFTVTATCRKNCAKRVSRIC